MFSTDDPLDSHIDVIATARGKQFGTILADPPWQFQNRTGKVAPEHKRLNRYGTMTLDDICALPVTDITARTVDRPYLFGGYCRDVCMTVSTSILFSSATA